MLTFIRDNHDAYHLTTNGHAYHSYMTGDGNFALYRLKEPGSFPSSTNLAILGVPGGLVEAVSVVEATEALESIWNAYKTVPWVRAGYDAWEAKVGNREFHAVKTSDSIDVYTLRYRKDGLRGRKAFFSTGRTLVEVSSHIRTLVEKEGLYHYGPDSPPSTRDSSNPGSLTVSGLGKYPT